MSELRDKLDDLKTALTLSPPPPSALTAFSTPLTLADLLGGTECTIGDRRYWFVERTFDAICPNHSAACFAWQSMLPGLEHTMGTEHIDPRRAFVLDIETGGFAGTPVFLIGVVLPDLRPLCVRQFLARDYPEEESILRAVAVLAAERDTWITFNGKSFDAPFLLDRATLHRVGLPPPRLHIDLLHEARRCWRGQVPNCKLTTLEAHILARPRLGDIPSSDVPDLFHHFIRTGQAGPLRPVLEHNQLDLVACLELLFRLADVR